MNLAFIGLGIMGSRMARNLLRAGHTLAVYNRSSAKAHALAGPRVASSPADAARDNGVLFTMLSTPEAVSSVALGTSGFLDALPRGALWVDCSTVNPSFSRRMASEAAARGVRFMDAPVTGSLAAAEKAELTFLVGGEAKDLEECRPLLQLMGKAVRHLGVTGRGASMKMVINTQLGSLMAAFSEALALGESLGFTRSALLDVLIGGPVAGPFLAGKRTKLETRAYDAEFPLRWQHKDLQLASQTAYETGVAMPVINAVKEIFGLAEARGLSDLDFSAVAELYQRARPAP